MVETDALGAIRASIYYACSLPFASAAAMPCYASTWQLTQQPSLLSPSPCTAWLIRGKAAASEFWPLEATKTADLSLGYATSVLTLRRPKDAHLAVERLAISSAFIINPARGVRALSSFPVPEIVRKNLKFTRIAHKSRSAHPAAAQRACSCISTARVS